MKNNAKKIKTTRENIGDVMAALFVCACMIVVTFLALWIISGTIYSWVTFSNMFEFWLWRETYRLGFLIAYAASICAQIHFLTK